MKRSHWMSEAGRQSGERAERLHQQALRERSPMEVFIDEFWLLFVAVMFAGGVLGAMVLSDTIPQSVATLMDPIMLWFDNRIAGFVVGFLGAFLLIDVPLTAAVLWLRKHRPQLFQRRRR